MVKIAELREKGFSLSRIARDLDLSKALISGVIHDKYNGSEVTKQKVLKYIDFVLLSKADLNEPIYSNHNLFLPVLEDAINNKKIKLSDKKILIDVHDKLEHFKLNQKDNRNEN